GLSRETLGAVLFASGAGYFVSGLVSGRAIESLGLGRLLVLSTAMASAGLFGYALAPVFPVVLAMALLIGLSSGAVDAGLNFYAAENFSTRVMNLLHAFFGFGAMIGPFIMAAVISGNVSWRWGYAIVGSVVLLMAVTFLRTRSIWSVRRDTESAALDPSAPVAAIVRMPLVRLQVITFFFVTGVEFTAGSWGYTLLVERLGIEAGLAGVWVGLYWGAMASGRLLLGSLSRRLGDARLVRFCSWGMLLGALLLTRDSAQLAIAGLIVFGLCEGPMFPTLMSLTPARLGSNVAMHAIGFQVSAAVLGGAVLPTVAGLLSARAGLGAIGWTVTAGVLVVIGLVLLLQQRADAPVSSPPIPVKSPA
nr:MFS transporter [Chloroflexia bacterium]